MVEEAGVGDLDALRTLDLSLAIRNQRRDIT